MTEQQKTPPTAPEALKFLDGILGGVAGSRQDHVAIQGAIGIIGLALQPKPEAPALMEVPDISPITPPAAPQA